MRGKYRCLSSGSIDDEIKPYNGSTREQGNWENIFKKARYQNKPEV
jgi:hypothetical protein